MTDIRTDASIDPPAAPADPRLYARSFADVYQQWYDDLDDPSVMVQAFAQRVPAGATILELGSGTGRLASPLHRAGYRVIALDASVEMLTKAEAGPHLVGADMATLPLATGTVDAVLIAYNTIFNLDSHQGQRRCFAEVSRVLSPLGVAAVEAFVTSESGQYGISFRDHPSHADGRIAIITGPDLDDPNIIVGSHVELGPNVVCRPWRLRYRSPAELDDAASTAGLALDERCGDWAGHTFDHASMRHVSWYERR